MTSLLVQLRTGKIGFNAFLHARKVPMVLSPRCPCGTGAGAMTVRHVLLACPTWIVLGCASSASYERQIFELY